MQQRLISIFKFAFFLGAGIFLVWWSIHKLSDKDYNQFVHAIKTANYYLIFPVFFILSASHLSRAIRWKILMKSMDYYPKLSNTFCAVMVGYLANLAFPRLGEILKCTILGKYEKVPPDKLVGTILIERAIDLLVFFIVIVISLLTQAKVVGEYAKNMFKKYFLAPNNQPAFIKIGVWLLIILLIYFLVKFILKKYHHLVFIQKIKNIFKGIKEGLLTIKNLKNKWSFIFHSIFIWCCYLGGTYLGFQAIKETAQLTLLSTFPILVFATVAMITTPGGIGLYPVFIMEAMKLYNIPESFGTANGWLQWTAQFVIILVVGFICLLVLPYINKSKNEIDTSHTQ